MTPPYIPPEIIETLVWQQHVEPRFRVSPPIRVTLRQRLGSWIVLVGQRLGGSQPAGTIATT